MTERVRDLSDGFKETEFGLIPMDWDVVPLRDLATEFFSGGTPSTKRPEFWDGNIPWMTSAYIDGLYLDEGAKYITSQGLERSSSKLVPRGNLLIGTRVGVGKVAITSIDIAISQDLTGAIVDRTKAHPEFLAYAIQSDGVQQLFRLSSRGTTIKGIPREDLVQIPIPLPPLPEQRRIARVLSTIQRAIAAQDDLIAAAREVKRSLMQRLFTYGPGPEPAPTKETEIGEIPEHWEVVALGDLARIVMGQSPPGSSYNQTGDGIPLINGPAEFGDKFPIFVKWTRQPTKVCQMGDILFCVRGNTTGRMNIADDEYCIGRGVASIQGIDELSDTSYLFFLLERKNSEVFNIAVAGGSTFPNITKSQLRNLKVPSPSLAEQQHIADMLSVIDRKVATEEQRKAALQALFLSMLHQLMTGQVRTPDTVEVPQ